MKSYHEETLEKVHSWITFNKIHYNSGSKHFYLQGDSLDNFSKFIISNAKSTVVVSNPYVERCSLSDSLIEMSKKGIKVLLLTRPIRSKDKYYREKNDYHESLKATNVMIAYHKNIHAKIVFVDNSVAVISSLNFTSSSSAGRAWEAGIVSIDPTIVKNASNSLDTIFESRDTHHQNPRIHIELEETIGKLPPVVFSYLIEPEFIPLWNDLVDRVERTSLPQKGSKQNIHLRNSKVIQESFAEFTENEKFTSVSIHEGRVSISRWELVPNNSNTLVRTTQVLTIQTPLNGYQLNKVQRRTETYVKKTFKQLIQVASSHIE